MPKCGCCNADLGNLKPPCQHMDVVYEFFRLHPWLRVDKDALFVTCTECEGRWGLIVVDVPPRKEQATS